MANLLSLDLIRWDSGTNVGEFDGHSRRVLSCAFKPTRPFRIATCGEDFLVNFYEGPPFRFKLSLRFVDCYFFLNAGRLYSPSILIDDIITNFNCIELESVTFET